MDARRALPMRTIIESPASLALLAPLTQLLALLALLALSVSAAARAQTGELAEERRRMVETQIRARAVDDSRVLAAMAKVPRHLFVPEAFRQQAYEDYPLPIGNQQTISQPYIVALMSALLELRGGERVLEIGTGSGYQAAVLAELAGEVCTIEILEPLAARARATLGQLGYRNVEVRTGDGWAGWPERAPFDGILVTAAPPRVPELLLQQLKVGGRMVVPVGRFFQDLMVYTRTERGFEKRNVIPVRFVPMTGEAERETPP
jgi:protein-L-isoaspartate(D-aspartate) O-methyltransferase